MTLRLRALLPLAARMARYSSTFERHLQTDLNKFTKKMPHKNAPLKQMVHLGNAYPFYADRRWEMDGNDDSTTLKITKLSKNTIKELSEQLQIIALGLYAIGSDFSPPLKHIQIIDPGNPVHFLWNNLDLFNTTLEEMSFCDLKERSNILSKCVSLMTPGNDTTKVEDALAQTQRMLEHRIG